MECLQLLLKIKLIKRLDIIIRSGKVIGDNVNTGANAVVSHNIFNYISRKISARINNDSSF